MAISHFLQQLRQQFRRAIAQHPLEILLIAGYSIAVWFLDLSYEMHSMHFAYWLYAPIFFVAIYLTRPYKIYKWSWLVPALGVTLLALTNDNAEWHFANSKYWGALAISAILLCAFPFKKENRSFTANAFYTAFNSFLAWCVGGVIFVLILLFQAAVDALFNIDFSWLFNERMMLVSFYGFTPLFFLIFQQRQKAEINLSRVLEIALSFIASPALMAFSALLYVYLGKIVLDWALPNGMVANIALPYLALGLGIYLLQCLCNKPRWAWFFKSYPYLSLVPFVMLGFAIEQRISAYGWTEDRIYLVALAIGLLLAYAVIMLPAIRQYRYIAWLAVVTIFAMTFVVNPKEIALADQSARLDKQLHAMNLLDEQGKFKADFDPNQTFRSISEEQLKAWQALESNFRYVSSVSHFYSANDDELAKFALVQQYGEHIKQLRSLWIYDDKIRVDGETLYQKSGVEIYDYEQPDMAINLKGYRRLIFVNQGSGVYMQQHEQDGIVYKYCFYDGEKDLGCIDFTRLIKQVFEKHGMDPTQLQSSLDVLKEDIQQIQTSKGNLVMFENIIIRYDTEKGYIVNNTSQPTILVK